MPRGIVIPVLREEPMYIREFNGLSDYQEVVGGYVEHLELSAPSRAGIFMDEEGRMKSAEFNARASLLVMIHNPGFLYHGANILGPAVVIGPPNRKGETQDVPQDYIDLLLNTDTYKVEVQTADDKEAWNSNQRRFTDVVAAYESAVRISRFWTAVEQVRVVAA